MKSRIVLSPKKLVLTYGITDSNLSLLMEICKKQDITIRQVMPSELDTPVKNLLNIAPLTLEDYPKDTIPCIVMCGINSASVDILLDSLRTADIKIPLKAMLTPINQKWSFSYLLNELIKEHTEMEKNHS